MDKRNLVSIEIARYPAHEMCFILIDGKSVFTGNYHDFHSGCKGSKIAGYDLTGKWVKGIESLANALKFEMIQHNQAAVTLSSKILTNEEYKALGF